MSYPKAEHSYILSYIRSFILITPGTSEIMADFD